MLPSPPPATCSRPPLPVQVVGIPWQQGKLKLRRPYVTVIVNVDASGRVTSAQIDDSSGDAAYDALGVDAIKKWSFAPAQDLCKAVAGTAEYAVAQFEETTFKDPCEHDATVLMQAQPEYPDSARVSGSGTRTVRSVLSLDPVGRVTESEVQSSSGSDALDRAAMRAALWSSYFPAVHACRPATGSYKFSVTFDPN